MSDKEHDPSKWDAFDQLRRVWRKWNLRAGIVLSFSLKVLSLRSCQRHHMRQCGTIFQILPASEFPRIPFQQLRRSTTSRGITQFLPKMTRTIDHNSQATGQCTSKWLTDSPLDLHIQHQSKMVTLLFLRFSVVRIFPKADVKEDCYTKNGGKLIF